MAKPPEWQRRTMHRHFSACRRRGPELLHLTALGIGAWDRFDREPATVIEALRSAEPEPLLLLFEYAEAKKGSTHSAMVTGKSSAPAQRLRMVLWQALANHGIRLPPPPRIRPHVTLNYTWRGCAFREAIDPIPWLIEEFLLVESITGEARHVVHGRFPIRPRQGMLFPLMRCSTAPRDPEDGTLVPARR